MCCVGVLQLWLLGVCGSHLWSVFGPLLLSRLSLRYRVTAPASPLVVVAPAAASFLLVLPLQSRALPPASYRRSTPGLALTAVPVAVAAPAVLPSPAPLASPTVGLVPALRKSRRLPAQFPPVAVSVEQAVPPRTGELARVHVVARVSHSRSFRCHLLVFELCLLVPELRRACQPLGSAAWGVRQIMHDRFHFSHATRLP